MKYGEKVLIMGKFNSLKLWNLTLIMKDLIMELNERFKVDYCYQKLLSKINAGRLLLIVTRGVYFDNLKILIHKNKRSKWAKQICNAKYCQISKFILEPLLLRTFENSATRAKMSKREERLDLSCASTAGGLFYDATRAVGFTSDIAGI